ncbi:MBOAT family protein [Duganella sp. Root198D2]|uniref:MBOAT family O-acyltransferase n=1 Tax=Duganella sp. Root198D2 TaxID=1736489 RepID=UPI00070E5C28|nr:MBOAT family O-acyltransferase [Duganella sp. Root198D2]KRB83395.1 hypothetical protein ASE26_13070 [Duganella sp. Root198D2]
MLFSSITFVFYFLPIFLVFYYVCGIRNSVLLTGSAIFYVWGEGAYVFLLLALLAINQPIALMMQSLAARRRLTILVISIVINIAVLGFFKYSQFALDIMSSITGEKNIRLDLHLPLGISFFVFQLVSYQIEVYRSNIPAERSFVRIATYIMMFPHLVAGPIVRFGDIKDELHERTIDSDKLTVGVQYFIVGLCQKVLIANSIAPLADHAFDLPVAGLITSTAWLGIIAYTLQIYFDFCGYSNMAIGLAFLLGFHFPRNFNYPYSAKSVSEFWRRWHISLSSWFRDYLYIPLGGSRLGKAKTVRNLLIVFFATGLWHGAAWNFVFWGLLHGFFVVLENLFLGDILKRGPQWIARLYTLLIVMFAWVFFRADTFGHACFYLQTLMGFGHGQAQLPISALINPEVVVALLVGAILSFPVLPRLFQRFKLKESSLNGNTSVPDERIYFIPSGSLVLGFVMCTWLLASGTLNPFLYFRF